MDPLRRYPQEPRIVWYPRHDREERSQLTEVPAATRALAILRYLARQAGPARAAAISRDLNLPQSTVYHLLTTLINEGFVVHLADDRRYGLGISAYELGTGYTRQAPLQRLARVPLQQLADLTGHNAHLAVLHGREVIYVIEERSPGRPPLISDVGVRLPAQLTATGRSMLAALPSAQVRALFPDPGAFVLRNDRGPQSLSALRRLLVDVRGRGYAWELGEVSRGFASIAVAVREHSGHPLASVAVTYPEGTVDSSGFKQLVAAVEKTAVELSRRIAGGARVDVPVGGV
jgi:DNA-binding IclR family transcriptional regulator